LLSTVVVLPVWTFQTVQPYRWLELRLSSCRLTQPLILVALQQQQQNGALLLAQPWL
jgi:hypothetical protein